MKCILAIGASGNFCLLPVLLVWTHANSQKRPQKVAAGWLYAFLMPLAARECHLLVVLQLLCSCWQDGCSAGAGDLCRGRGKTRLRVRHVGGRGALSQETWENELCLASMEIFFSLWLDYLLWVYWSILQRDHRGLPCCQWGFHVDGNMK